MKADRKEAYDVTVIGGGAGGYTAAMEATRRGFRVAMIEKDSVGGTCLTRGCVPTQCLLRDLIEYSSYTSRDILETEPGSIRVSLDKIMNRKNRVVDLLVGGTEKALLSQGIAIFKGEGTLLDSQTAAIQASQTVIQSKFTIIATGACLRFDPPIELDHQDIWDTSDALNMEAVPESIAILGGGHRAMTFAEIFHYLGSHIHLITEAERVLPRADREISSRYKKVLKEKNIGLFMNARIVAVTRGGDGNSVSLTFETKKGHQSLKVAKLLVLGRREANVEGLHLDRIGLSLKDGAIPVDRNLMTTIKSVYAIGDAVGGRYAAQKAIRDGTSVVRHLSGETVRVNDDLIPICLYTSPEVAYIGLTQSEAEKRGYEAEVGYFPFAAGARPAVFGQGEGIIKLVFEKRYGEILGAHIIGPQATELISLASMAMKNQLGLREIKEVVTAHPSFSESFLGAVNDALSMMT